MTLSAGTRLGPYEVTAQIGVGGMGEVYQATDTKLKRQVAIKVLPESVAADADRLARFQREAEVLASLNHPQIAAIYGLEEADGVKGLVMELVEGPTLADRIAQGAIPVDEALPIAKQIAEALEAAHEQGIIHRDLKPANVKVREDGTVKVLDFGLAKALEPAGAGSPDVSHSPTMSAQATQAGVILGTAAYMSPEQARGKPVDKRADVWSFGVVLYEMLTGKRAFEGEDVSLTLASVLKNEPDWEAVPKAVPLLLTTFLRRCLEKDPKQRVRDIGDVRLTLEGAFETHAAAAVAVAQPVWRQPLPVAAAALVVGGLIVGSAAWSLWPTADVPRVTRLTIAQPAAQPLRLGTNQPVLALSPDGTRAVYLVLVEGQPTLVVRPLDALEATVLYQGRAFGPFFSPDGAWVGFHDNADRRIKRVAVTGGPALTVSASGAPQMRGAAWAADDTIIIATDTPSGLWQVPVGGGTPEPLTTLDESQSESNHEWPELLPGGEAVLFTIRRAGEPADAALIAVRHLETGEQRVLVSGGSYPKYVPTGHLVYGFAGTLRAVPFDLDALTVTGNPVGVLEGVLTKAGTGAADVAVAQDGSLVYVARGVAAAVPRTLVWVDRQGREEAIPAPVRSYVYPHLSPDGTKVALDIRDQEIDIWVWDLTRTTLTRLTFDAGRDRTPVWTPDGQRIAFSSEQEGVGNLFWQAADGTGSVERLSESAITQYPFSFSPDGTRLVFAESNNDLAVLALEGDRQTTPLVKTTFAERNGEISPDGRWLAYQSDESGREEIYVRPFPDVDAGRWPVSAGGGSRPLWARSGEELFYLAPDGAVMRVAVEGGTTFRPDTPTRLFQGLYSGGTLGRFFRTYDVSPDGKRFSMIKEGTPDGSATPPSLILVLNWFEELKRLVPAN